MYKYSSQIVSEYENIKNLNKYRNYDIKIRL